MQKNDQGRVYSDYAKRDCNQRTCLQPEHIHEFQFSHKRLSVMSEQTFEQNKRAKQA